MGALKRLRLFVLGLAGLFVLGVLVLPEFGILTEQIAWLRDNPIGGRAVLGCVCALAVVALVCVLVALFAPRNARTVVVSTAGGDQIQVSRDAIRAQAAHIVEEDGTLVARSVSVWARRRGRVRVSVRVQPQTPVNVVECGSDLHDRLVAGLSEVCGDTVERVEVEFVDAVTHDEPVSFDQLEASYAARDAARGSGAVAAPAAEPVWEAEATSEDITVPISQVAPAPEGFEPALEVVEDAYAYGSDAPGTADDQDDPSEQGEE